MMRGLILSGLIGALPLGAAAHPHIFIDTSLHVNIAPDGTLESVEITWRYDELFSLLVLEDRGLDTDYDGQLTEAELNWLAGFDMRWVEGYKGDTYLTRDGKDVPLGPPIALDTQVENGQIITRHRREVGGPVEGAVFQVYDPTFYTAYDLTGGVTVTDGCRADVQTADMNAASAELETRLNGRSVEEVDTDFPEVGVFFADRVLLICD